MERETAVRNPIRETFFGCCASAVTATASSITAIRIDDTPAFFIAHLILDVLITRTEIKESVIYGGRRYTFVEYKGQSHAEIELNASMRSCVVRESWRILFYYVINVVLARRGRNMGGLAVNQLVTGPFRRFRELAKPGSILPEIRCVPATSKFRW
jgi:hypothetical protein